MQLGPGCRQPWSIGRSLRAFRPTGPTGLQMAAIFGYRAAAAGSRQATHPNGRSRRPTCPEVQVCGGRREMGDGGHVLGMWLVCGTQGSGQDTRELPAWAIPVVDGQARRMRALEPKQAACVTGQGPVGMCSAEYRPGGCVCPRLGLPGDLPDGPCSLTSLWPLQVNQISSTGLGKGMHPHCGVQTKGQGQGEVRAGEGRGTAGGPGRQAALPGVARRCVASSGVTWRLVVRGADWRCMGLAARGGEWH